jgi:hypothetical protein
MYGHIFFEMREVHTAWRMGLFLHALFITRTRKQEFIKIKIAKRTLKAIRQTAFCRNKVLYRVNPNMEWLPFSHWRTEKKTRRAI